MIEIANFQKKTPFFTTFEIVPENDETRIVLFSVITTDSSETLQIVMTDPEKILKRNDLIVNFTFTKQNFPQFVISIITNQQRLFN
jgi:hypothetical protein